MRDASVTDLFVTSLLLWFANVAALAVDGPVNKGTNHQGRITGTVVSAVTGKPVAGVYVGVGDFGDSGGSNYERHRAEGLHASIKTDDQGRFELGGLIHTDKHAYLNYHPLVITHPDHVPHRQDVDLPSGTEVNIRIALKPAAAARVTVVDLKGNPVRGNHVIRIEAFDGHQFIPANQDRHLSSFSSSSWMQYVRYGEFTFTELKEGLYSVDAIGFDSPLNQGAAAAQHASRLPSVKGTGTRYHGGVTSIELKSGEATQIVLKPQNFGTRLTIRLPEVPEAIARIMPTLVALSRNPGLLLWNDGKIRHVEDPRLGRLVQQMLFIGAADGEMFTIENLPPQEYSVFAGPPVLLRGARVTLAPNREETIRLAWLEPNGEAKVRAEGLSRTLQLETRGYTPEELCEILTGATGARPPFQADFSIRNETVAFVGKKSPVWNVLESVYLSKGWIFEEEGSERLILRRPGE